MKQYAICSEQLANKQFSNRTIKRLEKAIRYSSKFVIRSSLKIIFVFQNIR